MVEEIVFKDSCIQKGYRIKIPKAIVDTLKLREGQKIEIKFNPDREELVIKEESSLEKTFEKTAKAKAHHKTEGKEKKGK